MEMPPAVTFRTPGASSAGSAFRCGDPSIYRHAQHAGGSEISTTTRVNEQIRISPVRLIDAEGEQQGIVPLDQARSQAEAAGLDLVEVAAQARPPVVKIMDWGRKLYEDQKQAREARKKQHKMSVKEVQLRPRTDDHDFETKLKRARRFLKGGDMVRVVLRYRGREMRRPEVGLETLDRMIEATEDLGKVEQRSARIENRRLSALLSPQAAS